MADRIFYNGIVYTMDETGKADAERGNVPCATASAVAVKGHRIEGVGQDTQILALAEEGCVCIDLEGCCVLPGFNDTHCHILQTGLEYANLNLRGVRSVEEIVERGRAFIRENQIPEGAWVYGYGYDQALFDNPRYPDLNDADAISAVHPVLVERICGHTATANRMALAIAGFDERTSITGGVIEKDARGKLTGKLNEAALDQFKRSITKPDVQRAMAALKEAFKAANACGVTSVQTDDLEGASLDTVLAAYKGLQREGCMTVRVWEEVQCARLPILNTFLERGLRTGDGNRFFKIGNIKLLTDGSLGARTAFMREDYSDDPGNRGVAVYTDEALEEVVMAAHKSGMQIACHAIGDGSAAQCIQALGKAYGQDGVDLRNRLVHCQFADERMLDDMAKSGICADIQPAFLADDWQGAQPRMGERCAYGYVWKSMLEHGVHVGGGSDCPVTSFSAIEAIHCAVNRTDAQGMPAGGWHPEQKLSVYEAVKLYTSDGAYLSFEENEKGVLREGFLADLVVLDQDIFTADPEKIRDIRVCMTVMDGNIVYKR